MQSVDAKVAPQLIDYVRLMAQGMVDQSWAEKMLKFLDKFESELKTLREEKKFIVSEHFLDIMTKVKLQRFVFNQLIRAIKYMLSQLMSFADKFSCQDLEKCI